MFLDWIAHKTITAVAAAALPISDFLSHGTSRYFWLYCVTGLAIAAYGYRKHSAEMNFKATLLDKNVWLSQSAKNDYILIVIVPVIRFTLFSMLLVNWQPVSEAVVSALHGLGVSSNATGATAIWLGIALTVTLFIADDFLRWWSHFIFHRIPELWEFHKVHHSAEVLNFATAERHHPVEVIFTGAVLTAGYGVVNGLYIGMFGDNLTVTTIAGSNIFLFVFNICGGVLRHSPFWISFGPRVERWVISPAMHQIHHSAKEEHFDRNMGGSLAVWDRWAGTLHIPKGREVQEYGIGPETKDFRSMEVILLRPITAAIGLARRRAGATTAAATAAATGAAHIAPAASAAPGQPT